ncbi:GNAT family N-acetyltransferase [Jiangella asiatica]|uniref:GNAT family N-acetyltransferase n=1 Tax=Jiangella asiatica TaxID=2530372 RepID=UPI001EEFF3AC|nr:GNAT family N-acetyltransferase [Jiangella asiatica]
MSSAGGAPGLVRPGTSNDLDLLVAWIEAFTAETGVPAQPRPSVVAIVEQRLTQGRVHLWDDAGPVSYVGTSPVIAGVVRIGPVYTPPDHRGRGYASALVSRVSQAALDAGASRCMLYTDLANPTSNRIYAAIGYRPVADVTAYAFTAPTSA